MTLSRQDHQQSATIQVQKDAPVDLLLGTDLLPHLGFVVLQAGGNSLGTDLLQSDSWAKLATPPAQMDPPTKGEKDEDGEGERAREEPSEPASDSPDLGAETRIEGQPRETHPANLEQPVGVVKLLQATRFPARHQRLLRAKVEGLSISDLVMFKPEPGLKDTHGLNLAEAVVQPDRDNLVTLVLENATYEATRLKQGRVLGHLYQGTLTPTAEVCPQRATGSNQVKEAEESSGEPVAALTEEDSSQYSPQEPEQQVLAEVLKHSETLTDSEREGLRTFLAKHQHLFALSGHELGRTDVVTHSINTGDHPPIKQPVRRTPFALRQKVDELVQQMLEEGIICPSQSPWASPIVLVKKADGSTRFCVDYRRLNAITKIDVFPLPRIDDTLDLLAGTQYFSTLDLAAGYWQVGMNEESREKTAFATYSGLYEFDRMPFGLCNAPATFQRLMEVVLAGLTRKSCMVYIDDILIFSKSLEGHFTHLEQVMDRLDRAGLRLKAKKCKFLRRRVEYLGHVISQEGIEASPAKLDAIRSFPIPSDLKGLRSFLGLASYYRRFIPSFSRVAAPLHALTRKNAPFVWSLSCQEAFDKLEELLTTAPVLAYPDFTQGFILETDASAAGLGAVLAQEQNGARRPIAFASRTMQPHERNYGATEM